MKTLRLFFMSFVAIMLSTSFAACSGDDDEEGKSDGNASGLITDEEGNEVRVTKFGDDYKFTYNSNGQLTAYYADYLDYEVTQNPFTLSYSDEDSYESYTETLTITQNSKGYITKVNYKGYGEWENGNESENVNATFSFSYDGNDHLTKCSASATVTYIEDGEKENYNTSGSVNFKWNNNVLTSITYDGDIEEDDGDEESAAKKVTFDYGDNEYPNPSRQLALNYCFYDYMPGGLAGLSFIGMFGKGGDYLPVSVTKTFDDDDDYFTYNCSYGFNDNGTLNYERRGSNSRQYYTYGTVSYDDEAKTMQKASPMLKQKKTHRYGFLRHHSKR